MNKQPGTLIAPEHRRPHSLRLRLMLWYGVLLIIALGFFATLVLLLTADAINQSVDSSVRAEARLASSDVSRELSSTNPYWPAQLSLTAIDTYREPGVTVEVVDTNGYRRYPLSTSAAKSIPLSGEIRRAVLAGQPPVWYTTTVDGEQVRVEALPVRVPSAKPGTNVINA